MPKRPETHSYGVKPAPRIDLRPNSHRRGYDERWRRFRAWYLRRNPVCVECGRPATQVDHVAPLVRGGAHCSTENSQALCASCHSRKTAKEGRK